MRTANAMALITALLQTLKSIRTTVTKTPPLGRGFALVLWQSIDLQHRRISDDAKRNYAVPKHETRNLRAENNAPVFTHMPVRRRTVRKSNVDFAIHLKIVGQQGINIRDVRRVGNCANIGMIIERFREQIAGQNTVFEPNNSSYDIV
jgi:hypothetical protein